MSPKLRSLTMIGLVLYGTSAIAAPPTLTGEPIVANLGTDSVVINLRTPGLISVPNSSPTANAGTDQSLTDTDGQPGENVALNGAASSDADGRITSYVWLDPAGAPIAKGATPTVRLPDGISQITLIVTDDSGDKATNTARDTVAITIARIAGAPVPTAANSSPTANAGTDQSLTDTDGQPGENVALNGAASSDPDGTISSYVWLDSRGIQIATGATPTLSLPDGISEITLIVTDDSGDKATNTARDTVAITIAGTQTPTADAGANQSIPDRDNIPGEKVRLDGSASSDPDGSIVSYEWFDGQDNLLGSGAILDDVTLPDGDNRIVLVVRDNVGNTASDQVTITVDAAPTRPTLTSSLQGLTPTEESMAGALDDLCVRLAERARQQPLPEGESDLLGRCDGIIFDDVPAQQIEALDELGAQDLNAVRTQALLFSQFQYTGIVDRLIALRDGAHGLNLEKLTLSIDGKTVPLAMLESVARNILGGGASADEQEPGGLLADRWGIWASGNFSFGGKDSSAADQGFDADQWGFTAGVDYRLSDKVVLGAAIGFGESDISFNPSGQGGLDASAWTVSGYASAYPADNFYVDGIFNYSRVDYDAERRILYQDATGTVDRTARGSTDGSNLSAGLAFGYDFVLGGLTISPNAGFFYIDATVDAFRENGASGLDLAYDERSFESATGNAGLRVAYAWNLGWGVLLPQFRGVFVHEFQDDVEVFGVRFANDPFADAANPTPPIVVHSDSPDQSYWRFAVGLSAQFKYGVSGYAEYQRLEGFESIDFGDITFGLNFQRSF